MLRPSDSSRLKWKNTAQILTDGSAHHWMDAGIQAALQAGRTIQWKTNMEISVLLALLCIKFCH